MKNIIFTFYNLLIYEINKINNNYYFKYNNENYLFYQTDNNEEIINYTYNQYIINNLECYKIISNKDKKIFTLVDNKNYILLKINGILKYEIKINELYFIKVDKSPLNWGKLWSNRLNYYELQIKELGYNYQSILNTYGFYEGLASNAILYYNLTLKKFNDIPIVGIVHNRVRYPNYLLEYNNPANFIVDYSIRDLAEYIKSYILSKDYNENYIINYLEKIELNNLMFNILYSRLLYPTYYFDLFDYIILNGEDKEIIPILDITNNYIDLLKKIYINFKVKYNMIKVEWLHKKS